MQTTTIISIRCSKITKMILRNQTQLSKRLPTNLKWAIKVLLSKENHIIKSATHTALMKKNKMTLLTNFTTSLPSRTSSMNSNQKRYKAVSIHHKHICGSRVLLIWSINRLAVSLRFRIRVQWHLLHRLILWGCRRSLFQRCRKRYQHCKGR